MVSSKKRCSSSTSLPSELVELILYKVPIKSLLRFKSVCKQWNNLFNNKTFIYKHLCLSPKGFIRGNHKSFQLLDLKTKALSSLPIPEDFYFHTIESIHCDGLLLCDCFVQDCDNELIRKLAVWNPFLNRVKWIKPSSELDDSYKIYDVFGFGYDNVSCRDNYKILRISSRRLKVEIYEFISNLWRNVDSAFECDTPCRALSMNGNMYWIGEENRVSSKNEFFILSFDFSTETFKAVCCVPKGIDCSGSDPDHTVALSGFEGDKFCLLHQHKHVKIEVWVTTNKVTDDDNGVVSWSKYVSVTHPDLPIFHTSLRSCFPKFFIHKNGKIMVWCEEEDIKEKCIQANVYEISEGEIRKEVEIRRNIWFPCVYFCCHVYAPSLVPVPE